MGEVKKCTVIEVVFDGEISEAASQVLAERLADYLELYGEGLKCAYFIRTVTEEELIAESEAA